MLTVVVARPFISPNVTVLAQGRSSSQGDEVNRYTLQQVSEELTEFPKTTAVLDTKTGQLWELNKLNCGNQTFRQGWTKMPALGKNELPVMFLSCSTPTAGR
jgi:hypothetical protein